MARKRRDTKLPAPFLRRLTVQEEPLAEQSGYPFDLPWLGPEFELYFEQPVTIIVGENGTGKSTLVEAIAAIAGYDEAGGGKGYSPVDHSRAIDRSGAELAQVLRAGWLPKVTDGWFFRAESFFSVARYLDEVASPYADFLSWSHGEGFMRVFEERMTRQGVYFMDEPESALSPNRQRELLRLLARIQESETAQVILATHSPILMAVPGAQVLEITRRGLTEIDYRETAHFRLYRAFTADPEGFVAEALDPEGDA
ncbi:ABC transporter, ATP-binding protein [Candidatus Rhodobacter oscarellae]|uniref:ABC transporter, ATP-binding protein n=1 Tax=Candidatus Rhodobacter oscarellae TaxID=1675527 RepID=A0A0J9EBE6_9RHOB|nr:AAA family ATPase [Candidatus Rhodobacter lobularis]KMW60105.1 ABC transporter, ATP-binding protein [Candidatus Rhodobacter lobularis]